MKKLLSKIFAVVLSIFMLVPAYADTNKRVDRIAGGNREETSVKISKESFDTSEYAILATEGDYPDSLSGGQLALTIQAPILLTKKNQVSKGVVDEMRRLGVKKVFVLGGTSSISDSVLEGIGDFNPERLGGIDRYETSRIIANKTKELGEAKGIKYDEMVVTDGKNFPDALSANSYLYNRGAIMVLSRGDYIPKTDMKVTVIGGVSSLPFAGVPVNRIAGKDRYETSTLVAERFKGGLETAILASGESFPDALTSTGLMIKNNAPLLITPPKHMKIGILGYLNKFSNVVIVGGYNTISKEIEQVTITGKLIKPQPKPQPQPQPKPQTRPVSKKVVINWPRGICQMSLDKNTFDKYLSYKIDSYNNLVLYSKKDGNEEISRYAVFDERGYRELGTRYRAHLYRIVEKKGKKLYIVWECYKPYFTNTAAGKVVDRFSNSLSGLNGFKVRSLR